MIKGLEFLKSWRYWAWVAGPTWAMMLWMAVATDLSAGYFSPMADGSPDILYPILLGFPLIALFFVIAWMVFVRGGKGEPYPEKYGSRIMFAAMFSAQIAAVFAALPVKLFIPYLVSGGENPFFFSFFVWMPGWLCGQLAGGREWARMTGAAGDPDADPATSPDGAAHE